MVRIKTQKKNTNIFIAPINEKDCSIDEEYVKNKLKDLNNIDNNNNNNMINIISISGCSNIIGVKTNVNKFIDIIDNHKNNNNNNKNYLFVDYATLAPYEIMNAKNIDALFISGHKFIGGTSTPGILIANEKLFEKKDPYNPGGGCALKISNDGNILYHNEIERKEPGGTCNIVGIIKMRYCLHIVKLYKNIITARENKITKYVHEYFGELKNKEKYKNKFDIMYQNVNLDNRLSIICLFIYDLHYNFVVALLNDIFGIQTRGGISCCGLFEDYIKHKYNNANNTNNANDTNNPNGWCRITFVWYMTKKEIEYILNSIKYIIKNGNKYLDKYDYDKNNNLYKIKNDISTKRILLMTCDI